MQVLNIFDILNIVTRDTVVDVSVYKNLAEQVKVNCWHVYS